MVILVVEGLNPSTLDAYLSALERDASNPSWPSGLAKLSRDSFRFGIASRAETTAPATSLSAMATIATGTYPDKHGIVGNQFIDRTQTNLWRRLSLATANHGIGYWTDEHGNPASQSEGTLVHSLLQAPTWLSALAKEYRVSSHYFPFGHGAAWTVPKAIRGGVLAILNHPTATLAVPLLDKANANALTQALTSGHSVILSHFRSVKAISCFRENVSCEGKATNLSHQQLLALKTVDGLLYAALRRYQRSHPTRYANTTFMLIGTHSLIDRTQGVDPDTVHIIDRQRLLDHLGTQLPSRCFDWFIDATEDRIYSTVLDSGTARIYLPECRAGACEARRKAMSCLSAAAEKMANNTQWLSGVAWDPALGLDEQPLSKRLQIRYRPKFLTNQPAHRRLRLDNKIRKSFTVTPQNRSGDVVFFAAERWLFVDKERNGRIGYVHSGGINAKSLNIPFLIADRRLSGATINALRIAPIELADVAPTTLSLLGLNTSNYVRPPILRWRNDQMDTLEFVQSDRTISLDPTNPKTDFFWTEGKAFVELGVQESGRHWPPDQLNITFGNVTHKWDPDAAKFPDGLPCSYTSTKARRVWKCRFPKFAKPGDSTWAKVRRTPSTESDKPFVRHHEFVFKPSVPAVADLELVCADEQQIHVRINARDSLGLASLGANFQTHASETLTEAISLPVKVSIPSVAGRQNSCQAAAENTCLDTKTPTSISGLYSIPIKRAHLATIETAASLLETTAMDSERAKDRYQGLARPAVSSDEPNLAWLTLHVCNRLGQCASQILATDKAYLNGMKNRCGTP
ncbi:MAG: alkaline phosphatase family protein [Myxococcota bacterium]|nr:alkaline phosphatase family protein [Myxococcota bacterium]